MRAKMLFRMMKRTNFHSVDSKNGGSQEATEYAPAVGLQ
jgi:hypothetical protein